MLIIEHIVEKDKIIQLEVTHKETNSKVELLIFPNGEIEVVRKDKDLSIKMG